MKVYHYVKTATLEDYYRTEKMWNTAVKTIPDEVRLDKREWEKKEISLYLIIHKFYGAKMVCSIRCPINPLPVHGKFVAPSFVSIQRFLRREGWKLKGGAMNFVEENSDADIEFDE